MSIAYEPGVMTTRPATAPLPMRQSRSQRRATSGQRVPIQQYTNVGWWIRNWRGTPDNAENAGPAAEGPLEEHPGDAAGARGDLRCEHGEARGAAGATGRAGVEAKPANPEHGAADHGVEDVVGLEVLDAEALAGADDDGSGEAGHAGANMNDVTAGVVEGASAEQETVGGPLPMCDDAVHEEMPKEDEDDHRRELHSLSKGAADDCGGDDGEGALEHHEDGFRDGAIQRVLCAGSNSKR